MPKCQITIVGPCWSTCMTLTAHHTFEGWIVLQIGTQYLISYGDGKHPEIAAGPGPGKVDLESHLKTTQFPACANSNVVSKLKINPLSRHVVINVHVGFLEHRGIAATNGRNVVKPGGPLSNL